MASLVGEYPGGTLRARWSELVARTPGRAEFALRLALICALTTWLAQSYQTLEVALSAYIVFFMNKPDRTSSILICMVLTVLVSIVIGLLVLIAGMSLDLPPLRVAFMVVLSLWLLFLASASKLKPLAPILAMIFVYTLDQLANVPDGELATRALLYAWLMVAIPAAVSVVVNLLLGPAPRRLAARALGLRLRAAQALMAASNAGTRQRVTELRNEGSGAIQGHLGLAALEKTSSRADLSALRQATRSTDVLLLLVEQLARAGDLPVAWKQAAASTLGKMAAMLERGRYPVDIEPVHVPGTLPSGATSSLVADFNSVLAMFAQAPAAAAGTAPAKAKSGFFVPDAWTNPEHVRYAVKITTVAMACYLFYSLTDWPGIHTCLITCYVVGLDTTGETIKKLSLRIAGALVGAAIGLAAIVWLTPFIDRIGGLLALVFAGGLAGGWIAAGSPRIAYAGFQLTFAIFLCVIQGPTPAFDLTVARDRVIGILIGNAAMYLVFVTVWPVSIARRIDPAIAALLRQLRRIAALVPHDERLKALPEAHAAIANIDTDMGIAYYEPASLRPPTAWLKRREVLLDGIPALETSLLHADEAAQRDFLAARLDRLANAVDRGEPIAISIEETTQGMQTREQDVAH
jgi:multidrug resistance protein MdtO